MLVYVRWYYSLHNEPLDLNLNLCKSNIYWTRHGSSLFCFPTSVYRDRIKTLDSIAIMIARIAVHLQWCKKVLKWVVLLLCWWIASTRPFFLPLCKLIIPSARAYWLAPYQRSISTSDPQELDNADTEYSYHPSVSNTSGKLQQILYKNSEERFDSL